MRKIVFISCAVLLLIISSANGYAQIIYGKIGEASGFSLVTLHYNTLIGSRQFQIDSAKIVDGEFIFHYATRDEPSRAKLLFRDSNGDIDFKATVNLFLDGDSILIVSDTDGKFVVLNSEINYDFAILKELTWPGQLEYGRINGKSRELAASIRDFEIDDKQFQRFVIERGYAAKQQIYQAQKQFIRTYPNSWISLYAIDLVFRDYHQDVVELSQLFASLAPYLRESATGKDFTSKLHARTGIQLGSPAPLFELPNANGDMVRLQDYRGRFVLLEFWSSTCGPCRQEAPHLIEAHNKYYPSGFDILGISLDDNLNRSRDGRTAWLNAIEKDGTGLWQQVCDLKGYQSPIVALYQIYGIPQNYLLDPEGKIIAQNLRGAALHAKLKELFEN